MEPTTLAAVWLIKIHVYAMDKDRYVDPEQARHRTAYFTEAACKKKARLVYIEPQSYPMIEVRGAVCRMHPLEMR